MSIGAVRIDVDECAKRALHGCALAARAKYDEVRAINIAEADARTDVAPTHGAETTEDNES